MLRPASLQAAMSAPLPPAAVCNTRADNRADAKLVPNLPDDAHPPSDLCDSAPPSAPPSASTPAAAPAPPAPAHLHSDPSPDVAPNPSPHLTNTANAAPVAADPSPPVAAPPAPSAETAPAAPAPQRRLYSKPTLPSLRHARRHPLPPDDPICATAPAFLPYQPPPPPPGSSDVQLSAPDKGLTFAALGLPPPLLAALREQGLAAPSPVQAAALPPARLGLDLVTQAKSGTGKTLVFALAALEAALRAPAAAPAALVLAPTRELAAQIRAVVRRLAARADPPPHVDAVVGGVPERDDAERLAALPPRVLVGTPGRVLALLKKRVLAPDDLRLLVLDEADRLLDGALSDTVPRICALLPEQKQSLAFSATFPVRLQRLLARVMRNPRLVQVGDEPAPAGQDDVASAHGKAVLLGVRQRKMAVGDVRKVNGKKAIFRAKIDTVTKVLRELSFKLCIVFSNNKEHGKAVSKHLRAKGFKCKIINAEVRQSDRVAIMESAQNGKVRVLVATDVLARGVDIESCDLVVQLDVPSEPATYLHRVGRAGRFGKKGISIVLYSQEEDALWVDRLEKTIGFRMPVMNLAQASEIQEHEVAQSDDNVVAEKADGNGTASMVASKEPIVERTEEIISGVHVELPEKVGMVDDGLNGEGDDEEMDVEGKGHVVDKSPGSDVQEAEEESRFHLDGLCDAKAAALKELNGVGIGEECGHKDVACEDSVEEREECADMERSTDGEAGSTEHIRQRGPSLRGPSFLGKRQWKEDARDSEWETYARKAYQAGYREAYECAFEMAKELRRRLER